MGGRRLAVAVLVTGVLVVAGVGWLVRTDQDRYARDGSEGVGMTQDRSRDGEPDRPDPGEQSGPTDPGEQSGPTVPGQPAPMPRVAPHAEPVPMPLVSPPATPVPMPHVQPSRSPDQPAQQKRPTEDSPGDAGPIEP